MDGLRLADRIAYGGGMAARKAGVICDSYRAIDGTCPLVPARRMIRLGVLSVPVGGGVRGPAGFGVQCNEVITLWRTAQPAAPGLNPYGAVLFSDARVVLAGFPAALMPGGVSDRTRLGLPDDTKLPGYVGVVAAIDGAGPLVADIVRDGRGRQFVVDAAARFGGVWRLALTESVA